MDDLFLTLCIIAAFAAGFLPGYLLGLRRAMNRTLQMLDEFKQGVDGRED